MEVKSVQHLQRTKQDDVLGYKASTVSLNKNQWLRLCEYSDVHNLTPLLVVELRVSGSRQGPIYHLILREAVNFKSKTSNGDRIRFSVYDLGVLHVQAFRPGSPYTQRCIL